MVWDPEGYGAMVRAEVPEYERLQDEVAGATADLAVKRMLELGTGTGITTRRVLAVHPQAQLVGIDSSPEMLEHARRELPGAELRLQDLRDRLPDGPFDLVFSSLAVHHLDRQGKADLFERVAVVLAPGGRFVLADVIVPEDPADVVTPLDEGFDLPDTIDGQLTWLRAAGLDARVRWRDRDLAVLVGDRRQ